MNAVLILAHKNDKQLDRLVRRMLSKENHIFIHVDKKWQGYTPENDIKSQVTISSASVDVALDHFSLVEAVLLLLDEAKKYELCSGVNFKYYILMSGQDYPIKSVDYICKYLQRCYPRPLIDCTLYDENNWLKTKFARWRPSAIMHYYSLHKRTSKYASLMRKGVVKIEGLLTRVIGVPKNLISKYTLAGGSAWWILLDIVIDYILN